jgi:aryl sulfotransferase
MGDIVWLASYPKSGNTWVRVLLTNYLRDGDEPADINDLMGGPIASARTWFDEWVGVEASALEPHVIDRLRPEVYRCLAGDSQERMFMKVHDAWSRVDTGQPMFPADVTAGVVYIIRNPLDMAASCANHWGMTVDAAVKRMNSSEPGEILADGAPAPRGLPDQLRQRLGSWSDHVRSWVDMSELPLHLVRYEDLQADPEAVFGSILGFCGFEVDRTRLTKAVAFSKFGELQRQEGLAGFRERSGVASDGFFRRGRVEGWRHELGTELVESLVCTHGELMGRFDYVP